MRPIKFRAIFDGEIVTNMSLEGMFAHYENGSCKLEQFTGLQDRKGNDIYEGDILLQIPYHYEKPEKVIVKFTKFERCGGCPYQHWGMGFDVGEYNADHLEIIGNIHSNPDLLENKQCEYEWDDNILLSMPVQI